MKKRFAAVLAATAVLGVTTAFAANPFSDVEAGHWAYQSVSQLAAAGIINGYPDGTFKGQNNITRYEMAQMVAKAMANQGRADAEQNAMINRLADEFSEELNNLGVRVGNLEKRVGNVKVTGDFRLKYEGHKADSGLDIEKKSQFDYRARLQFNAMVNDKTTATVRVTTDDIEFGKDDNKLAVDLAYVSHQFGNKAMVNIGRQTVMAGQGLILDTELDGIVGVYGDKTKVTAGYLVKDDLTITDIMDDELKLPGKTKLSLVQVDTELSNVALGAFWLKAHNGALKEEYGIKGDIYGVNAAYKMGKVTVDGEYAKLRGVEEGKAWIAGIGYGDYDIAEKGTWDLKLQYLKAEAGAPLIAPTFDFPAAANSKGWAVSAHYGLAKNVGLGAYYTFNGKTTDDSGIELPNAYRVELNYQF